MAKTPKNAAGAQESAAAAQTGYADYEISAKVLKVQRTAERDAEGKNTIRYVFTVDKPLQSFDAQTGEPVTLNTFSLNSFVATQMLSPLVDEIGLADALLGGGEIPFTIVSLAMRGADITLKRIFKAAKTKRDSGDGIYKNHIYKTEIVAVTTNVQPLFALQLQKQIDNLSQLELQDMAKRAKDAEEKAAKNATDGRRVAFGFTGWAW